MNQQTRKTIAELVAVIEDAKSKLEACDVETLASEEREKFDNLSEGLQASEQGQRTEAAADALDTAQDALSEALDSLQSAIDELNTAAE